MDIMSTFHSSALLLVAADDANSTARAEEMDVFPTPPLPPTKMTGVLLVFTLFPEVLLSPLPRLLFFLLAAIIDAISSTNGCNECNRVVDGDDDNDDDVGIVIADVLNHGACGGGRRGIRFKYDQHGTKCDSRDSSNSVAGGALTLMVIMVS